MTTNNMSLAVELHATGLLHMMDQGEAKTFQFEQGGLIDPMVLMMSLAHTEADLSEAITLKRFSKARIYVRIDFDPDTQQYQDFLPRE